MEHNRMAAKRRKTQIRKSGLNRNTESTEFFPLRPPWPPVPKCLICVNLRDLRANAFLSEFAAVDISVMSQPWAAANGNGGGWLKRDRVAKSAQWKLGNG
jgi:hypothetical protein